MEYEDNYLAPSKFIDSNHPDVIRFAERNVRAEGGDKDRAIRLFLAVRDDVLYDPYVPMNDPESYRARAISDHSGSYPA